MYNTDIEKEIDRDRGILTPRDRKFLAGKTDMKDESKRQVRQRIRERITHSIRDYMFIRYGLEERDRELIGNELFKEGPLWEGYVDMFAFYYILNRDRKYEMESEVRNAIESAEEQLMADRDETVETSVTFDVQREIVHDHDDLLEKFENHEEMTPEEAEALFVESQHFGHLTDEQRWNKFGEFLNGELEAQCVIDETDKKPPLG